MESMNDPCGDKNTVDKGTVPLLEAKNLKVIRGGNTILNVTDLSIKEGEIVSLIGPNGSGKSTLLQALCCLLRRVSGDILFRGMRVNSEYPLADYRRKSTMVFQEPLLFDTTVYGNVVSGLIFRKVGRSEIREIVMENLELFSIGHLADRSARTLSGG
jgi:tungstate transport system ATP-binding protein